ncbi:minor tail protein [Microbacterium phage Teamocil]|uniref:Minor tail protein n=1 Tax=Microbacterium phage Teamocil TaxID=2656554 RepID=A0A649VYK1_9CAUD|nr:minor tail protein [Microbacterium phage Teamocil]QGJ88892.1 minor tail protein [Microbacterium phage Gina]QGJ96989.1 minor tail protein [Microbacterium phage Teamocil]
MLDEYLALGGVELGNNARALAYSRCLPCCVGLLKGGACDGIHDATNDWTDAVYQWLEARRNWNPNPRLISSITGWSTTGAVATLTATPTGGRVDVTALTSVPLFFQSADLPAVSGDTWSASMEVTVPTGYPAVSLQLRSYSYGNNIVIGSSPVTLVQPGTTVTIAAPNTSALVPAATGVRTILYGNGAPAGARFFVRNALAEKAAAPGPYFDGSTMPAGVNSPNDRVRWLGTQDASASVLERNTVVVPAASTEPPYTCNDIQRAPWYDPDNEFSQHLAGFYLLSVKGITDSTSTATVTEGIDDGGVIGASRHSTRSVRVRTMIIGCGNAAAEYGLAWLKAALSETFCARHGDACGTSDLAFFIDCPPALDAADANYAATTARYRRYLHGVGTTSGAIIAEEYETPSGAYVIVVEYILTAESPFVWGETLPVASTGDVLTAYDDIPFNLMRHPNAEVGDGIPAVTATQYVFNGSVEYGATGWANAVTNIAAGITAGASTDIAAVGPNSYRVRLLATGAVTAGQIATYYDVALGSLPGGSKPSLSVWAAALTFAGAPTLDPNLTAEVEWRNGGTVLSTTPLGTIPLNGGNASATGLTIPATATTARIRVRATNITAAAADDLRLYADAFSLTVP